MWRGIGPCPVSLVLLSQSISKLSVRVKAGICLYVEGILIQDVYFIIRSFQTVIPQVDVTPRYIRFKATE